MLWRKLVMKLPPTAIPRKARYAPWGCCPITVDHVEELWRHCEVHRCEDSEEIPEELPPGKRHWLMARIFKRVQYKHHRKDGFSPPIRPIITPIPVIQLYAYDPRRGVAPHKLPGVVCLTSPSTCGVSRWSRPPTLLVSYERVTQQAHFRKNK